MLFSSEIQKKKEPLKVCAEDKRKPYLTCRLINTPFASPAAAAFLARLIPRRLSHLLVVQARLDTSF